MSHHSALPQSTQDTIRGGVRVLLAETLLIPTALLTAAFLGRRLGPEGYGIFTVATAVVGWVEWSLSALLGRAAVKFVAETVDWRPMSGTILTVYLATALTTALLLWLLATPIAAILGTPVLAGYLRLFAADIPIFSLAQAHRSILVGLGNFAERAYAAAARWVSRFVLIVVLVQLGFSIWGAIWGCIGASLVELAVARFFVRPAFSARGPLAFRKFWSYAAPLLLSALALRLYDKLDLVTLTALGGTAEQAGRYGAAQNLAALPTFMIAPLAPLLLSLLSRAFRDQDTVRSAELGRGAMRGVLLLVPLAGLIAGSAGEIVRLVFGPAFDPAAPLLAGLIFSAVALVQISVASAVLTAASRPGLTLAVTAPLPLLGLPGYLVLVPWYGPMGAVVVTLVCATLGAVGSVIAVYQVCRVLPPGRTALRSALLCTIAFAVASLWTTPGLWILVKLPVMSLVVLIAFAILREFSPAELIMARSAVSRRWSPAKRQVD